MKRTKKERKIEKLRYWSAVIFFCVFLGMIEYQGWRHDWEAMVFLHIVIAVGLLCTHSFIAIITKGKDGLF